MTHPEMDQLYELYALGALEPELAAEIDEHLATNCSYCMERVQEAADFAAALAGIAETKKPPKALRDRVLAGLGQARSSKTWILIVAALSAACLGLLVFSLVSRTEMSRMQSQLIVLQGERAQLQGAIETMRAAERNQLSLVRSERDQLQSALTIIRRPDTRSIRFGNQNAPHGWVFVNRAGGLVLVGAQLPRVASDRTLELWLVPVTGAPRPAGLFRPNAAGDSLHTSSLAVNPAQFKAVAVSVEPRAGSSAPTTKPFLLVPLG